MEQFIWGILVSIGVSYFGTISSGYRYKGFSKNKETNILWECAVYAVLCLHLVT